MPNAWERDPIACIYRDRERGYILPESTLCHLGSFEEVERVIAEEGPQALIDGTHYGQFSELKFRELCRMADKVMDAMGFPRRKRAKA